MNPHSFSETLATILGASHPEWQVCTPVSSEERAYPYVLLTLAADDERIPSNHTWECGLEAQFHSNAYDLGGASARHYFSSLCADLEKPAFRIAINEAAPDFYLYGISLLTLDVPQVQDDVFIQTARFRVMLQF